MPATAPQVFRAKDAWLLGMTSPAFTHMALRVLPPDLACLFTIALRNHRKGGCARGSGMTVHGAR